VPPRPIRGHTPVIRVAETGIPVKVYELIVGLGVG